MFELTLLVIYRIVQAEKGWHVSLLVRSCWRCLRLTVLTRLLARWVVWNGRIIEHRQHLLLEAHKHPCICTSCSCSAFLISFSSSCCFLLCSSSASRNIFNLFSFLKFFFSPIVQPFNHLQQLSSVCLLSRKLTPYACSNEKEYFCLHTFKCNNKTTFFESITRLFLATATSGAAAATMFLSKY